MSILYETIFEIKYFEHIYYQYLSVIIYLYLQQSDNKMNSRILVYWHDQNELRTLSSSCFLSQTVRFINNES